jgi:hypothetical protein
VLSVKKFIFVAVITALMFAGCTEEDQAGWHEMVPFEQKPVPVVIVEQETNQTTEPAVERFAFGDEVYSVRTSVDGGEPFTVRYMVVAQIDAEIVAVVPMFTPDPDETRAVLLDVAQMPLDESGYLDLVLTDNCYTDRAEAEAAAEALNRRAKNATD